MPPAARLYGWHTTEPPCTAQLLHALAVQVPERQRSALSGWPVAHCPCPSLPRGQASPALARLKSHATRSPPSTQPAGPLQEIARKAPPSHQRASVEFRQVAEFSGLQESPGSGEPQAAKQSAM